VEKRLRERVRRQKQQNKEQRRIQRVAERQQQRERGDSDIIANPDLAVSYDNATAPETPGPASTLDTIPHE